MTIREFYELTIKLGMEKDPRSQAELKKLLAEEKKQYEKLDAKKKKYFDTERLTNPYADTRILCGDQKTPLKKLAAGIDLESADLLLVHELNKNGAKIDLALSHHPEGIALARLADVMKLQEDLYHEVGVPINVIEKLMDKEITRVGQSVHPVNHEKNVDVARLLNIPYACTHTVADNQAYDFLKKIMDEKKSRTVGDVIDLLLELPEYEASAKRGVEPVPFVGSTKSRAGKVVVTGLTGGTSGSSDIYESMKHAGVGTEIVMHLTKEHREKAEKHNINVIVAGHIASDSLGMNLLLDEVEKQGIEIVALGGYTRFSRV